MLLIHSSSNTNKIEKQNKSGILFTCIILPVLIIFTEIYWQIIDPILKNLQTNTKDEDESTEISDTEDENVFDNESIEDDEFISLIIYIIFLLVIFIIIYLLKIEKIIGLEELQNGNALNQNQESNKTQKELECIQQLSEKDKELNKKNEELKRIQKKLENLKQQTQRSNTTQLKELEKKLSEKEKALEQAQQKPENSQQQTQRSNTNQLQEANKENEKLKQAQQELEKQLNEKEKELNKIQQESQDTQKQSNKTNEELNNIQKKLENSKKQTQESDTIQQEQLNKENEKLKQAQQELEEQLNEIQQQLNELNNKKQELNNLNQNQKELIEKTKSKTENQINELNKKIRLLNDEKQSLDNKLEEIKKTQIQEKSSYPKFDCLLNEAFNKQKDILFQSLYTDITNVIKEYDNQKIEAADALDMIMKINSSSQNADINITNTYANKKNYNRSYRDDKQIITNTIIEAKKQIKQNQDDLEENQNMTEDIKLSRKNSIVLQNDKIEKAKEEMKNLKERAKDIIEEIRKIIQPISDNIEKYKNKTIEEAIGILVGKTVKSYVPLYKFDKTNQNSFHNYINNKENILICIKMTNGNYIIGFSEPAFKSQYNNEKFQSLTNADYKPGLMFSVTPKGITRMFTVKKQPSSSANRTNPKSITCDPEYLIWGNSDIRIRLGPDKEELYSNYSTANCSYEEPGNNKPSVNDLFLQPERTTVVGNLEIYQVEFDEAKDK